MSQDKPKPEHKDRTALYIAIVGATATVLAAAIGVLPNLLNRAAPPPPTPIVITATPAPTQVAEATAVPSTPSQVAEATTVPPTPLPALSSTPNAAPSATPAARRVDFLVTNNRQGPFDFYIDGEYQITVPPGGYQILRVIPGEHTLTHCPQGTKPSDASGECETLSREVRSDPYDWQLGGTITARDEVLLFLLNQIDADIDVYVDGQEMVPVDAHKIGTIQLTPGNYEIQSCPRGEKPAEGECGTANEYKFQYRVEMYVVNIP